MCKPETQTINSTNPFPETRVRTERRVDMKDYGHKGFEGRLPTYVCLVL